jgi:hypothetical protein
LILRKIVSNWKSFFLIRRDGGKKWASSRKEEEGPILIHTTRPEYRTQFISFMVNAFVLKAGDLSPLKANVGGLLEEKKTEKGEMKNGRRKANDC